MTLDEDLVREIAKLARIRLPENDISGLAGELSHIFDWIEQLNEVDTAGVEPMTSVTEMDMPFREDIVTDGDKRDDILANAPDRQGAFFTVPKVME